MDPTTIYIYICIYPSIPIVSYYILINGYYGCFPHILRCIHSYISQPIILGQFPAHSLKADFVTYSASIRLCESLGCVLQQKWAAGILKPCSWLLRRWEVLYVLSLADTCVHFCTHYMGLSENRLNPYTQWLMIIIPIKWLFHWEYTLFSDKPICVYKYSSSKSPKDRKASSHYPIGILLFFFSWGSYIHI